MNLAFAAPRLYQDAYPFHPRFFAELEEAITRTAYHTTFAAILPAQIREKFHTHAATAPLRGLRMDLANHFGSSPKVGHL